MVAIDLIRSPPKSRLRTMISTATAFAARGCRTTAPTVRQIVVNDSETKTRMDENTAKSSKDKLCFWCAKT